MWHTRKVIHLRMCSQPMVRIRSHRNGVPDQEGSSFQPVHTLTHVTLFGACGAFLAASDLDDAERVLPATDDFDQRLATGPYARPRLI